MRIILQFEAGTDEVIENSIPLAEQIEHVRRDSKKFKEISKKYYIY